MVPTFIERDLTTRTIAHGPNPIALFALGIHCHAGDAPPAWLLGSCETDDVVTVGDGLPSSLIERQKRLRIRRPDVVGPRTNEPVVRVLLEAVRGPAGDAADGEDRREEIDRDAERVVRGRRVEVHVRVKLFLAPDERLHAARQVAPARVAGAR